MESAQKLTTVITQIIEFAKMVPGFMSFPQDDQIVLLKGGEQAKRLPVRNMNPIYRVTHQNGKTSR